MAPILDKLKELQVRFRLHKPLMVGLGRLELPTSRLSGVRSNQAELQARYSD